MIEFTKMSGSGNDFVFIDGRRWPTDQWTAPRISSICARKTGVGADGLVVLEPGGQRGIVRFHYFNADGGRTDLCGNASLCAVRISSLWNLSDNEVTLETDVGRISGRVLDGNDHRAEVILSFSAVQGPDPGFPLIEGEVGAFFVQAGVPHLVVLVDDVNRPEADPGVRGRELRWHPCVAPNGANVNFVVKPTGAGPARYRTYERGVEGETLACGTGAIATALAMVSSGTSRFPVRLKTSGGPELEVDGELSPTGELTNPILRGEGRLVFVGHLPE